MELSPSGQRNPMHQMTVTVTSTCTIPLSVRYIPTHPTAPLPPILHHCVVDEDFTDGVRHWFSVVDDLDLPLRIWVAPTKTDDKTFFWF